MSESECEGGEGLGVIVGGNKGYIVSVCICV